MGFVRIALSQYLPRQCSTRGSSHTISVPSIDARDNISTPMLSTPSRKEDRSFVFVSALNRLLKERGKNQTQLAAETGLSRERINRLARQIVVHTIVARTSLRICFALSSWPRLRDGTVVPVRLDTLYPLKRR